jgi:nicotinamidase/pyrazinamidase
MACHYKPYHLHYDETFLDLEKGSMKKSNETGKSALIIMDVQKDFLVGGSMSILYGKRDAEVRTKMMINNINSIIKSEKIDYHIYVQDAHKENHISFASSHEGYKMFQVIDAENPAEKGSTVQYILYPTHCVIPMYSTSSCGIEFADDLLVPLSFTENKNKNSTIPSNIVQNKTFNDKLEKKSFVFNKGETSDNESFSAFKNYYCKNTGLHKCLIDKGISRLYICGLATDFGVWWTAADASSYFNKNTKQRVFDVSVIWDSCLPVPGNINSIEYSTDPSHFIGIKSKHHDVLQQPKYSENVQSVADALIKPDPSFNKWVDVFLTPYGVKAIKTDTLIE